MTRHIVDMEASLIWHGTNCVSFRGRDDLWAYLTKAKAVPERTVVKPTFDPSLIETVEQALRRGLAVKKIGRSVKTKLNKEDISGLAPEDLLTKLGLM